MRTWLEIADGLMWAFGETCLLASQVGSVLMLLTGYFVSGLAHWLARNWFGAGEAVLVGVGFGCSIAAALEAEQP